MTSFEDRLWAELASEHATELPLRQPRQQKRPPRRLPAAVAALALIGVILATIAALTTSPNVPAFVVVRNSDGTVTVTISELEGVTEANTQLSALGVRARAAAVEASCTTDLSRFKLTPIPPQIAGKLIQIGRPDNSTPVTLTPSLIPSGDTLLMIARQLAPGVVTLGANLYRGPVPSCIPATAANEAGAG